METIPNSAAAYRAAHYRKLMVLTTWKSAAPEMNEFCRINSVETLSPGLWVTATFLDGSVRRFRPEKIRDATPDEEQQANAVTALNAPAPV
jgi:hypothetical protein